MFLIQLLPSQQKLLESSFKLVGIFQPINEKFWSRSSFDLGGVEAVK